VPYLLTTLLYASVALLVAADAALVSLGLVSPFTALRWVRVHFITLGIISQVIFGMLPALVAFLSQRPRPPMRWSIWLALNAGLISLVAGIAGVIQSLILAGGILIFTAASLLLLQLWGQRNGEVPASLKFYLTGVFYLLVGILIGTGLWLNWSQALYIQNPLEAHIHANIWGFMSLVFAGLLVDFVPLIASRPLGSKTAITSIYWGLTLGAFGLVLGPWLGGSLPPTVSGLILYLAATGWLLGLLVRALKESGKLASAGAWHLISSYFWLLPPVLITPFVALGLIKAGPVEFTAPQTLIYGWALQFAIALIPFFASRFILKEASPRLGGCWGSLAAVTVGSALVWASIIILPARSVLYGIGFIFYALALIHPLKELAQIARTVLGKLESA